MVSASAKEFPPFRLDPVNQCLWRRGDAGEDERVLLTPKAFAVLSYLIEHAGRLVTQDELLEAVWPDTFVQPEVLKYQIADIRSRLGDDPKSPRFIETLPRRGYQFIAAVHDSAVAKPKPSELAGSDRMLGELWDCLRRSFHGERQIVFIATEPGIGKATVADEFQHQAAANVPGIRVARGQCVEGYGSKEAYYPMLEALGQLCRGSGGDKVVETLAAHAPTWLVQLPAVLKREHREMLQQEILGATRQRMLREIGDALNAIASGSPLLLVLEDLQWADPFTMDLISAVARSREQAKLMLVGTYRQVDVAVSGHPMKALKPDLLIHHLCREIALQPLETAA
jgi:DNA-binding winged helix-turn-helix (wHTH) protein